MKSIGGDEIPSVSRRRLSQTLPSDVTESTRQLSLRRLSALSTTSTSSSPTRRPSTDGGGGTSRRNSLAASVLGRRASILTRVFALPRTSEAYRERGGSSTLINAMLFLTDPRPDVERIRSLLEERLLVIPRFRSVWEQEGGSKGGNGTSQVRWVPIPRSRIDMGYHVTEMDGRGTFDEGDISSMVSRYFIEEWDNARPLWQVKIVSDLKDGRSLLYIAIDHAIGDGIAMLQVFLSLLDDPAGKTSSEIDNSSSVNTLYQKRKRNSRPMRISHRIVSFFHGCYTGVVGTILPTVDPRSSLTMPHDAIYQECPSKTFVQTKAFQLKEMKLLNDMLTGTTINDLVLAIITIALRNYFIRTKDEVWEKLTAPWWRRRKRLTVSFPVDRRAKDPPPAASADAKIPDVANRFSGGNLTLPLADYDPRDPVDAVWSCKTIADELKTNPGLLISRALFDLMIPLLPDKTLAALVTEGLNSSTCMISNVRGTPTKSSMGGYDVDDLTFTASVPMGLYIGILSYGGSLRITAVTDGRTAAEPEVLRECLEGAYEELKEEVYARVNARRYGEVGGAMLRQPECTPGSAFILELTALVLVLTAPLVIAIVLS